MDEHDIDVRRATYRRFVDLGRAPTSREMAASLGVDLEYLRTTWRRLHDAHALVLDEEGELRMANPFSAVPTAFRVAAAGRSWYANCAWDAFGIGAALRVDSRIATECPDCHGPIALDVRSNRPADPGDASLVFHVLVPAVSWWEDIGFT